MFWTIAVGLISKADKGRRSRSVLFIGTCSLYLLLLGTVNAALPLALLGDEMPTLAPMLERVMPAVVNISTTNTVHIRQNPLLKDPYFRYFFNFQERPRKRQTQSLGSGVIFDAAEGIVVTNTHVIDKADEISVALQDGRTFVAELIGTDPESDIAVIKIAADNLREIKLGDSDGIRVGDFAVAIGNPFGLNQTVTSGIISALGRSGLGIEGYEDFIQTDASINPGNSGGALVNLHGELIGINTAILAPSGGNVGIGFAIPINMVKHLTGQLIEYGRVQRGQLGVYAQDLTGELAQALELKVQSGALVAQVLPGSPAETAGLSQGDVIVAVNGRQIEDATDLRNRIGLLRVGQILEMRVVRKDVERTVEARIDKAAEVSLRGQDVHRSLAGATFSELPGGWGQAGVVVDKIDRNSNAWAVGLRADDIIVAVNRREIVSIEDFARVVSLSESLLLEFIRGESAYYLTID